MNQFWSPYGGRDPRRSAPRPSIQSTRRIIYAPIINKNAAVLETAVAGTGFFINKMEQITLGEALILASQGVKVVLA